MRGERPAHAADQRRVARDRRRRVEIMRVDPVDVVRQLARQHAGLAEPPAPVDRSDRASDRRENAFSASR